MYLSHTVTTAYLTKTFKVNVAFSLINSDLPINKLEIREGKVRLLSYPLFFSPFSDLLYCFLK